MKTISITNQKGGVGKTSTASALMEGLSELGYKVLGVDLDGQANLSLQARANTKGSTVLGLLLGEIKAKEAVQETARGWIIPGSSKLTNADRFIETGEELKAGLHELGRSFDFCIIDTPPALCARTLSALIASDSVVIPAKADLFSLQGIDELADTIAATKAARNKKLKVAGILLTCYKSRSTLHKEIIAPLEKLAADLGTTLFNTRIRDAVAVSEAPFLGTGLFASYPKSNVVEDYRAFIKELLERI